MSSKNRKATFNQTVQRAAKVLKCLGESGRPLGISEISKKLDMPASTVYRTVSALEMEGLLDRNPDNRRYGLSVELFALVRGVIRHIGFGDQVRAELRALARKVRETVYLGVLRQNRVIYLESIESDQFLRTVVKVWSVHPAHTTAIGKVILAHAPEHEVAEYLEATPFKAYTPSSIESPEELRMRFESVRELGYTFDDEECDIGVRAVGAPVRNVMGEVVAGIAIAGPSARMTDNVIPAFAKDVMETSRRISCILGWDEDLYMPFDTPVLATKHIGEAN